MGGVPTVLCGSREQLPPVVRSGTKDEVIRASPASHPSIKNAVEENMTVSVRIADPVYEKFVDKAACRNGWIALPEGAQVLDDPTEILKWVFPLWNTTLREKLLSF